MRWPCMEKQISGERLGAGGVEILQVRGTTVWQARLHQTTRKASVIHTRSRSVVVGDHSSCEIQGSLP